MHLTRHEVSIIRTALHTERRAGEIAESRMAELEDWLASLQLEPRDCSVPTILTSGLPTPNETIPHGLRRWAYRGLLRGLRGITGVKQ